MKKIKYSKLYGKRKKYPYAEAYKRALEVLKQLKPYCERIEIAGSIRRKKSEVGDIELVIIPKPYSTGLFESGIATVVNKWEKVKKDSKVKEDIFSETENDMRFERKKIYSN